MTSGRYDSPSRTAAEDFVYILPPLCASITRPRSSDPRTDRGSKTPISGRISARVAIRRTGPAKTDSRQGTRDTGTEVLRSAPVKSGMNVKVMDSSAASRTVIERRARLRRARVLTVGGAAECPDLEMLARFEVRESRHLRDEGWTRKISAHELFLIDRAFDR